MRKLPTILAAAAIGLAPVVIFTVAPANAVPCPNQAQGAPMTPTCLSCLNTYRTGTAAQGPCFGLGSQAPVTTGCVGSANDCANRIAACAAGLGPCPYSYRIKPNSYRTGPDCLSEFTQAGREACEKVCAQPGAIGCGGPAIGRLPGGDTYTPVPEDPWGHGN
jgi:hypothetical protein